MTRISTLALAVFAFILLSPPMLLAQQYDIRLSREAKIGDKYRVSTTARHAEKMTAFVGNTVVKDKNDEFTVELVLSITVRETNESGRVTKRAIGIEKCLVTTDGKTSRLYLRE